jgi:hypothetical protein
MSVSTCGGAVDVEVLVRGKRLFMTKNIGKYSYGLSPVFSKCTPGFDFSANTLPFVYRTIYNIIVVPLLTCKSDIDLSTREGYEFC